MVREWKPTDRETETETERHTCGVAVQRWLVVMYIWFKRPYLLFQSRKQICKQIIMYCVLQQWYTYVHRQTYIHTNIHAHLYICMYMYLYKYMCIDINVYAYTCNIYITYIQMHIHTYKCLCPTPWFKEIDIAWTRSGEHCPPNLLPRFS